MKPDAGPETTRRELRRCRTVARIKAAGMAQVREGGAQALSLNAIARGMAMSPPALYRYFASRDALLAELALDVRAALAERLQVAAARDATPAARIRAVVGAYRDWALAQPDAYSMAVGQLFGSSLSSSLGQGAPPGILAETGPPICVTIRYTAKMTNTAPPMNRRERLRAQTLQEIEDASFAIIDAEGVEALSIAAIARSMSMSAPAVYRYFASRDALVAHLVTMSYQQLATAMGEAVASGSPEPRAQVQTLVAAYRGWALDHRRRYGMLFGERAGDLPVSVTTRTPLDQAMSWVIDMLLAVHGSAPAESTGDSELDGQLRLWVRAQERPDTPASAARAAILVWTRVHGIVSLELTGLFANNAIEARRLIDLEIDDAIRSLTV